MAPKARAAAGRSSSRGRGGQSSIAAAIPTVQARPHPSSRAGMADADAGTLTARMKLSRAASPPAAK